MGGIKGAARGTVTVASAPPSKPRLFQPRAASDYGSVKSVVADLIDHAGGVKRAAHRFGISESLVGYYANPGSDKEISFARVAALSGPDNIVAAGYLAALCGGAFLPMPHEGPGALSRITAAAAKEFGEAMAAMITALADGVMTPGEARAAMEQIDQSMHALAQMRSDVAEIAEGREDA